MHSPISESVAERLRAIAKNDENRKSNVFIKVGDSHSASRYFLRCFAGSVELGEYQTLGPSIDYFKAGDAAGTTPFTRTSLATMVGVSANWPLAGSPTPLAQEIAATSPRFAFVAFGTNDMQFGPDVATAAFTFYRNLSALSQELERAGVIPILIGLVPRRDSEHAEHWVKSYDAITRGIAEQRQLPYVDLFLATKDLPNHGLARDGIHGNVFRSAGTKPCDFTKAGLDYAYDVRNLESLRALDAAKHVVVDAAPAPDAAIPAVSGDGSASAAFVIDSLPFTHSTEAGTQRYYELRLNDATPIRALLLSPAGVDVGLRVDALGEPRRVIERKLAAGEHQLVVDAKSRAGSYLLVVVRCDPTDVACT